MSTRIILWLIFFWVLWRLLRNVRIVIQKGKSQPPPPPNPSQQRRKSDGTFSNIQDAEFEDITSKPNEPQ